MRMIEYVVPGSLNEALAALKRTRGKVIAGGTDLCVLMAEHVVEPAALVDVGTLSELQYIKRDGGQIRIGAGVKIADIAESADLPVCLVQGAGAIGSPQIRNLATLGGNICNASPCGDTLSPLVALDAEFVITGSGGERLVKAEYFFLGPKKTVIAADEILTEIRIPILPDGARSAFRMIGKRKGQVISQVNTAVFVVADAAIRDIRISVGSVAPIPLRLKGMETALKNKKVVELTLPLIRDLVNEEIKPIDDVRATETYRRHIAGALTYEALMETLGTYALGTYALGGETT